MPYTAVGAAVFPTDLSLISFQSKRNQLEDWRNSFQMQWNWLTKQVDGNSAQLPTEDRTATVSGPGDSQLSLSLRQTELLHPSLHTLARAAHGQWLDDAGYKGRASCLSLGQLWRDIPAPELPKGISFLKDQLRSLLWLYHNSPLFAQCCFFHSGTMAVFKNTPLKLPASLDFVCQGTWPQIHIS